MQSCCNCSRSNNANKIVEKLYVLTLWTAQTTLNELYWFDDFRSELFLLGYTLNAQLCLIFFKK
jgi:hypothetical protein